MKRFVIILIVLIIIGGSAYYYFLHGPTTQEMVENTKLESKLIVDENVISPVASYDNGSIWYFNSDGRLLKVGLNGSKLSEFPLGSFSNDNFVQALWPKKGFDFIIISTNNGSLVKTHYNSTSKLYTTLASNVQAIEWLPDGKRVVYIWQSNDKKSQQLVIANADGTGFKTVTDVFWPDLALRASDDGKTILMYRTERVGETNKIYAVDLNTAVVSTLVETGNNFAAKWVSADKFIYSRPSKILVYDITSKQSLDLDLNSSLDKTVSDPTGQYLYAAVPTTDGSDKIIKVNVDNGSVEAYFQFETQVYVRSLLMVGNTVHYIDNRDGKLYAITK
jgi:dipeptidyl aminopeptidase/acylaminoacyl peptidase